MAPARKRFGAASEHNDLPHVGSGLSDQKMKLMKRLFPEIEALVRMVAESDEVSAEEFDVIFRDLQSKITAVQAETRIGKISSLNDPQAARHDSEMADMRRGLEGLKRRISWKREHLRN